MFSIASAISGCWSGKTVESSGASSDFTSSTAFATPSPDYSNYEPRSYSTFRCRPRYHAPPLPSVWYQPPVPVSQSSSEPPTFSVSSGATSREPTDFRPPGVISLAQGREFGIIGEEEGMSWHYDPDDIPCFRRPQRDVSPPPAVWSIFATSEVDQEDDSRL